jgi:hypothetical protein
MSRPLKNKIGIDQSSGQEIEIANKKIERENDLAAQVNK